MVDETLGTLFVVSTPIGNMGDFSFRGVDVLRSVKMILAEDTRRARQLLTHYDISVPLTSYHERNEAQVVPRAMRKLREGASVALVSDAGTPLLSDPGERLVRAAVEEGITVNAVPGASALLASLVVSALPADHFTYYGFLPRKGVERQLLVQEVARSPYTVVLYEAANRLVATLKDLVESCGELRPAVVSRELTKLFEETRRGTLAELIEYYEEVPPRGEVVLLVSGVKAEPAGEEEWRGIARTLIARGLSTKDIVSIMVKEHGAPRNLAYRLAQEG